MPKEYIVRVSSWKMKGTEGENISCPRREWPLGPRRAQ